MFFRYGDYVRLGREIGNECTRQEEQERDEDDLRVHDAKH